MGAWSAGRIGEKEQLQSACKFFFEPGRQKFDQVFAALKLKRCAARVIGGIVSELSALRISRHFLALRFFTEFRFFFHAQPCLIEEKFTMGTALECYALKAAQLTPVVESQMSQTKVCGANGCSIRLRLASMASLALRAYILFPVFLFLQLASTQHLLVLFQLGESCVACRQSLVSHNISGGWQV